MKRHLLPLLLFASLVFVAPSQGQDDERPKSTRAATAPRTTGLSVLIIGPESVNPGALVKLDASKSDAESFQWKLAGGTSELYDVAERGRVVYFSSPVPGTYRFILAVAKNNTDPKVPPFLTMAEHTVIVQGVGPVPPTPGPRPPEPVPPTPDPLPAGRFGLARFTRDLITNGIPAGQRGPCDGFSANYNVVASQIAAGAIKGLSAANLELQKRNRETAGAAVDTWKTIVFTPLGSKMSDLVKQAKLDINSAADLSEAFAEVSAGFAGAK